MTEVRRAVVLGGTSEIGLAIVRALGLRPGASVLLAGRDPTGLDAAARMLPADVDVACSYFDAGCPDTLTRVLDEAFALGPVDLVVPAFGVLGDQAQFEDAPATADALLAVNVVAQVHALLETARRLRIQDSGTIVVLSSVASVRPRRANYVYGASKAALDAAARGLADSLHGTGVRVLLVRPGFVIGRMTQGMPPAPLATTPDAVGAAVARALSGRRQVLWVPAPLGLLAAVLRLVPRPLWRRLRR